MLCKEIAFSKREWIQFGVKHVVKNIPGGDRTGVLAPEILKKIQGRQIENTEQGNGVESDGQGFQEAAPAGNSGTAEMLRQREFVIDHNGYEIKVTAYDAQATGKEKPAVVYFHGGGWRTGSRADVEEPLRFLARLSGAVVFNVEYRLAPEYRYPTATDDCWRALRYLYSHADEWSVDAKRITVAGDSAGGNIAAVCARRDRNARTRIIRQQVLIYPVLAHVDPIGQDDYHFSLDDYEFDDSQAKWIVPSINAMRIAVPGKNLYVSNKTEAMSPDASPLFDSRFDGLPKTFVICAEYDYLTQQCRTYAKRLAQASVDTTLLVYRGTNHGFINHLGEYPQVTDLLREFTAAVKTL